MKTKFNECILHFLYGQEITGSLADTDDLKLTMKLLLISKQKVGEAHLLAAQIVENIPHLDGEIKKISREYELDRISKVDLVILRWALFAREHQLESEKGIIKEAIRLSKKFSTTEASKFIHAILDAGASPHEVSKEHLAL